MGSTGDLHRTQSEPARDLDPTPPDPKDSPVPFVNPRTGERAQLATIAEAADALRCTQRHIYHLLAREKLSRLKIGGLVRVDLNEIAGLITVDAPGSDVA
jgi:excisionase family DNA binding protein